MPSLITIDHIRSVRPVAANIDVNRYEMFIEAAQNVDLKQALNAHCDTDFVYFLTQNQDVARVQLILEGGTYEYNNDTYEFSGINKALALYAYARIVQGTQATVTGDSVSFLQTDWAVNASVDQVRQMAQDARTQAYTYVEEVVTMLCRKSDDYPEFTAGRASKPKATFGMVQIDKFNRHQRDVKFRIYGDKY